MDSKKTFARRFQEICIKIVKFFLKTFVHDSSDFLNCSLTKITKTINLKVIKFSSHDDDLITRDHCEKFHDK